MTAEQIKRQRGAKLGRWVLSHKLVVIFISLLVVMGFGFGAKNLKMSSDYRYFFNKNNPQRIAYEEFQNKYSKDDSVLILIEHKSGTVFNKSTLNAIKELTDLSWKVPYSNRVDSLTNYQHTEAQGDDLIVRDLVGGVGTPALTDDYIAKIKKIATSEPLLVDNLVNPEGSITAINIRANPPQKSSTEVPEIAAYVRKMIKEWQQKNSGHEVHLTGMIMMNNAFNEAAMKDMSTLIPAMYLLIFLIMAYLLRSIFSVLNTFFIIILSVVSAMGFAGWMGIPITPPSSIAPTVILTLAIADSVHLLKAIIGFMKKGMTKADAIIEGLRINLQPIFLTSLTTAIGFLSLNFSDTPPFHDLGNITAVGVMFAFALSVTFLPVLVAIFPLKTKVSEKFDSEKAVDVYSHLAEVISRYRKPIMLFTLFLVVFLGLQVPKIKLNDQYVEYFDTSIQFRVDSEYFMDNLSGIYQVNYDLKSGESQGISDPKFLNHVQSFVTYAKSLDGVEHVSTITDTFKRLNKNMHADDLEYYRLPDNRELAAQYLLLYEMSLPYGLDLNNQIDVDKSSTRVIVTLGNVDTATFLNLNNQLESWLKNNTPETMHTIGASPAIMFAHITEKNVKSMAWGTLLAFLLISAVLMISLRSFRYGVISLLPNMIPAFMAFGVWSLTVGEAGFAIAVVTSVTLGIVVDDTVHFLTKYVRARREKGLSAEEAVKESFAGVGTALVATTVILTFGFGILMFSPFLMNWTLGALSAMTIAIALIVDFTFLPAILVTLDKAVYKVKEGTQSKGKAMSLKNATLTILVIVSATLLSGVAKAETLESDPVKRGLQIAKEIDSRDQNWGNQVSDVEMILKNKQGQKSVRKLKIKSLEVKGDGDKSLTVFKSPRDVKGTAFLSFTHPLKADDQWLYLPALKRVKRISSHNKSGPFMGSEFAFEDISSQEVEKYTYKYIKDEEVDGKPGYVVERYPVDKNSGYTRQVAWVDSVNYLVHKVDYYDRKGDKLKTLQFKKYHKFIDSVWRAEIMDMVNHQNGKSTEMVFKSIKFKSSINERDFDKNALKRVK
jgi:predicted RND superfamily exporter protein